MCMYVCLLVAFNSICVKGLFASVLWICFEYWRFSFVHRRQVFYFNQIESRQQLRGPTNGSLNKTYLPINGLLLKLKLSGKWFVSFWIISTTTTIDLHLLAVIWWALYFNILISIFQKRPPAVFHLWSTNTNLCKIKLCACGHNTYVFIHM